MPRTPRRAAWALAPCLALLLGACSCGTNPLASGVPGASSTVYNRPSEPLGVPGVFFAPQNGRNTTLAFLSGPGVNSGAAYLDIGTEWDYATSATNIVTDSPLASISTYSEGVLMQTGGSNSDPMYDAFSSNPNDSFVRFEGRYFGSGLPNGSTNYIELPIYYYGNAGPGVDISAYHGFSFWTRGTGNFSVCLMAGSQAGNPAAPGPYIQLNFYQYLFNQYLTGSPQWHQVTVYFADMTQIYGLATNLQQVLQGFYGLQFMQMGSPGPPVVENFWLDVDYIRFF